MVDYNKVYTNSPVMGRQINWRYIRSLGLSREEINRAIRGESIKRKPPEKKKKENKALILRGNLRGLVNKSQVQPGEQYIIVKEKTATEHRNQPSQVVIFLGKAKAEDLTSGTYEPGVKRLYYQVSQNSVAANTLSENGGAMSYSLGGLIRKTR